jgi:hypothetical protein
VGPPTHADADTYSGMPRSAARARRAAHAAHCCSALHLRIGSVMVPFSSPVLNRHRARAHAQMINRCVGSACADRIAWCFFSCRRTRARTAALGRMLIRTVSPLRGRSVRLPRTHTHTHTHTQAMQPSRLSALRAAACGGRTSTRLEGDPPRLVLCGACFGSGSGVGEFRGLYGFGCDCGVQDLCEEFGFSPVRTPVMAMCAIITPLCCHCCCCCCCCCLLLLLLC